MTRPPGNTLHYLYAFFFSRLQIPVASHRHFSSLARRLGRIFAHAYFHHREAFEQAEAESSLYARFLALTERFELVPAEFLVIPMDGHNVGGAGDSLGPPPSRSPRDEHRRSNEFDRGYHQQQQQQQQQQQRTRYDLDLANFHNPNFSERNPSPPGSSSSESGSGGIGESPSPSSRARVGRTRTGTMVFAEAEANSVTDELAARSSLREREQEEPQKIELLERDREPEPEPEPLKTVVPAATPANEEEDVQVEISLRSEVGKSGEEGSSVASEMLEESPAGLVEKHDPPSLLDSKLEPEAAENTAEIAVVPSAPAEPEVNVPTPHSSMEEEPAEPSVSSTEVKSDDSLETQPIPTETTTDHPPANDNVSIPELALIPEVKPETAVASEEVPTKVDANVDEKETIPPPPVINDSESPTIEASVEEHEMPADKPEPEVVVDAPVEAGEEVAGEETKA